MYTRVDLFLQAHSSSSGMSGLGANIITLLQQNFELVVRSVGDPNGLAREACRVGLMSPQVMAMLTSNPAIDNKNKTINILHHIMGVVSCQPYLSQHLLSVLQSRPELNTLLSMMLAAGKLIKHRRILLMLLLACAVHGALY